MGNSGDRIRGDSRDPAHRSSTQERYGGTLRRFIRATYLQEGYELGVIALLLMAVVLLGAGHGGTTGSAGAVAAGFCLLSIAVLPPLLNRALGTTSRDFLREDRSSRLTSAVRDEVDTEVQTRLGVDVLRGLAQETPIDLERFAQTDRGPDEGVVATQVGIVVDIKLGRLLRLARSLAGAGGVGLPITLGDYVGTGTRLLTHPADISSRRRRQARRIVAVSPGTRREQTLRRYLDDLHEEAVAAIRGGTQQMFDFVADAYVDTLMEFPKAWRTYRAEYDEAVARGIELFPVGPVDEIRQQFYTNITEALRAGDREIVLTAAYLPVRVASQALDYRAEGLIARMLSLSPPYLAASWTYGGPAGQVLEERSYRHLLEFVRFYLQPRLDRGLIAARLEIADYIQIAFAQIQALLKLGVDAGRTDFVRALDGHWGTLLQHWHGENLEPNPATIPYLEDAVAQGQTDAVARLARAQDNARLVEAVRRLQDYRTTARFGLALWAWRQQPTSWRESFRYFSTHFPGITQITSATTYAIEESYRDQMPWSDWILNQLQEGEAHFIPTTEAIIDTFVAMAIRAIVPGEEVRPLPATDWFEQYLDYARNAISEAITDGRNSDLPDVADRARILTDAVQQAAQAQANQERLRIIAAPLVQAKVDEFREQARAALLESRVVPDLLRLTGGVTQLEVRPEDPPLIESYTTKRTLIEGGRMVGVDMIAKDIARQVAHLELRQLVEPMSDVPRTAIVPADVAAQVQYEFAEQLRRLIMRAGTEPTGDGVMLFLPIEWRLFQALGLPFLGTGTSAPTEWSLSKATAHDFVGDFSGIPVFRFPEVPDGVLYLVDLRRYVRADAWPLTDAEQLAIRTLSEDDARQRAEGTPSREELGVEETALRWREQVFFRVDPGFRLHDGRDISAVTAVEIPASLA